MPETIPTHALQMVSQLDASGTLQVRLVRTPVPQPAADEVLVRIEATPINPSDIGNVFIAADLKAARTETVDGLPALTAPMPAAAMKALATRVGAPMPVGNEGAGLVVAAGSSAAAQGLMGRRVAAVGGGMYTQYRALKAAEVLPLPPGITAAQGASCFVNPLTALGMVETMKLEGHKALVHTAAASNLGQMLNRLCIEDGVPLVNIVRSREQAQLLREQGAKHVCDSSAADFDAALADACAATGATLAFDAIGGGTIASRILAAMETALARQAKAFSRYGTSVLKQVYLYGSLDTGPTELRRSFGMTWGVGGWLLFNFLQRIGPAKGQALRERVVKGLTTTFASHYAHRISLADALRPEVVAGYTARGTGAKYLIEPALG
jgi:NADPH:quinone reductase-like Zn-dependent oxidoreductase